MGKTSFAGETVMDCYFHSHVPAVATCTGCATSICATCRDEQGTCPSCRLASRIDAVAARGHLPGGLGPSRPQGAPAPRPQAGVATVAEVSGETRALLALGYPFWPLAALALLDPKRSPYVKRHALQAIGFNFGVAGLGLTLATIVHIPWLGLGALPMLALLFPIAFLASFIYGFRVWRRQDVRVPLISDWLDERESHEAHPGKSPNAA